ncbi:50S ribosomal protein L19 [Patescibacteria group bacterium]|nr:50S ribosomal protein L19 [Patescibacteria group bacterium]
MSYTKLAVIHKLSEKKGVPKFGPGYTVEVHQRIKEGEKERIQIFKGLVIKVSSGTGTNKSFTVRKIVDGIGVEKIFPIHSTNIVKIVPLKKAKIRRSKLYYMRERFGKSARFKETHLKAEDMLVPEEEITGESGPSVEDLEEAKVKIEKEEAETAGEATEVGVDDVSEEVVVEEEKVEEEKKDE